MGDVLMRLQGIVAREILQPDDADAVVDAVSKIADLRIALSWFVAREAPIQAKFNLHGPADTAAAMKDAFKAAKAALAPLPSKAPAARERES